MDATLITAHSEKEQAAGNYKHGYGFHPLGAYADQTCQALAILLRPGHAGSNTAADHITVIDRSLAQIPADQVETIEILISADSAGATHDTADHCLRPHLRFSFGYERKYKRLRRRPITDGTGAGSNAATYPAGGRPRKRSASITREG